MNYNNVKNPFDIYDEEQSKNETVEKEVEPKKPEHKGKLSNIFIIALYVIIMALAFVGTLSLSLPAVRTALLTSLFG